MRKSLVLLVFTLSACVPVVVSDIVLPSVTPLHPPPVYMSIPAINLEFPLIPRPGELPYESGPAFWRINGYAMDVASHCTEVPGMYFGNISIGNVLTVIFDDDSTLDLVVSEIIVIKYESPSDPLHHDWIDQATGIHYTVQEFSNFVMLRKDAWVLHSSLCGGGISFGQRFLIAQ